MNRSDLLDNCTCIVPNICVQICPKITPIENDYNLNRINKKDSTLIDFNLIYLFFCLDEAVPLDIVSRRLTRVLNIGPGLHFSFVEDRSSTQQKETEVFRVKLNKNMVYDRYN